MEFPYGGNHHHHRDDDENFKNDRRPPYSNYPPPPSYGGDFRHSPPQTYPPPPSYGGEFSHHPPGNYPPPPQVAGVYHTSHTPHFESQNFPPPPPPQVAGVHHVSHMGSQNYPPPPPPAAPYEHQTSSRHHEYGSVGGSHHEESDGGSHHFRPHMPGFIAEHFHHSSPSDDVGSHHESGGGSFGGGLNLEGYFGNKPSHMIYCKAGGDRYCVAIRDGKVLLTYADPNDPTQHWYKDEKYSTKVKDEDGYPSFALVNKATGKALKHSVNGHPVDMIPYKPDHLDASVLWTESKDLGSGFRTIRNVNNVRLVLDAFNGDKDHGGVHDGTIIAIYKCWKGDNQNQQWRLHRT
ncbi:ricin B-like lectin R40G3 isoform X2 [Amaranthus tricolor]|nr:ricin B-like lectin R40G3 isoform X2 [Amaranthus tricolor]